MVIYTYELKNPYYEIRDEEKKELNYKEKENYEETYYKRNYLVAGYAGCKNSNRAVNCTQE